MATAVHMDSILPSKKQGTSFQMLLKTRDARIYGLFVQSMQLHTHQIFRNMEHS